MKINNKLSLILITVLSVGNFFAQPPGTPPGPPGPGGSGGTTPGAQSIPVDMYIYGLAAVAILLILFFTKKYKTQKI